MKLYTNNNLERRNNMITLTILAVAFAVVAAIILALGAGFIVVFGDVIVAVLIIMGIIKLIGWLKHRNKEAKEEAKE